MARLNMEPTFVAEGQRAIRFAAAPFHAAARRSERAAAPIHAAARRSER